MQTMIRSVIGSSAALGLFAFGTLGAVKVPAATAAPGAHLKAHIKVFDWLCFSQNSAPGFASTVLKSYRQTHPGIRLTIVPPPTSGSNFVLWENTVLAEGTAPQIIAPPVAMEPWQDIPRHWYMNLTGLMDAPDPYVPGNHHLYDLFAPKIRQELQFHHQYWSIAWSGQDAGIWYNKADFRKAGIRSVPATWAQFLQDMRKLKQIGVIPMGFDLGDTTYGDPIPSVMAALESLTMQPVFNQMTHSRTKLVTVPELVQAIDTGAFRTTNPRYEAAWKLLKAWSAYFEPGAAGVGTGSATNNSQTMFERGKVAMFYAGSYVIPSINKIPHLNYGVFPIPQLTKQTSSAATPGYHGTGVWGGWGACPFAVTSTTKTTHTTAAVDNFIQYLSVPQNQERFAWDSGYVSNAPGTPVGGPPKTRTLLETIRYIMDHPSRISEAETALGPGFEQSQVKVMQSYVDGQLSLAQAMSQMENIFRQAALQTKTWIGGQ